MRAVKATIDLATKCQQAATTIITIIAYKQINHKDRNSYYSCSNNNNS